jgi:hypothetical protein
MRGSLLTGLVLLTLAAVSCGSKPVSVDKEVTSLGTAEVSAQLLDIPSPFPPNDLYNYAYVMKYKIVAVHRGKVEGNEIFVAHYNPLKPRTAAQDEFSGRVGGHVERFRAGDVHRIALQAPLDQFWMGGVIDKYFSQKGVRYWAVWTNPEAK